MELNTIKTADKFKKKNKLLKFFSFFRQSPSDNEEQ